ncbi:MAG: metallophosphoesterase [Myxococcales bacterium]|nr:metallophosphoesterase [Myxococcales bacterium]
MSDLHLLEVGGVSLLSFLNKRATGAVNLLLKRAHSHQISLVEEALTLLATLDVDQLAVTGDISNLSLDSEFALAARILEGHSEDFTISVIPGNHDRYVYSSARKRRFEHYFSDFVTSDLPDLQTDSVYPYVRFSEGIAIIGLSSSIPTPPFFATGTVSAKQLEALDEILELEETKSRYSIVLVHHPLSLLKHSRFDWIRRLTNADEVIDKVAGRADLVLHGHNHRPAHFQLTGRGKPTRVIEAGSASTVYFDDDHHFAGRFNLYEIGDDRELTVRTFSYDHDKREFVEMGPLEPQIVELT